MADFGLRAPNAFDGDTLVRVDGVVGVTSAGGVWAVTPAPSAVFVVTATASAPFPTTPPADPTITGTLAAIALRVTLPNPGTLCCYAIVITGTWVGTLNFVGSVDGSAEIATLGFPDPTAVGVASTAANGTWFVPYPALHHMSVGFNPYTSGTATITIRGSAGSFPLR